MTTKNAVIASVALTVAAFAYSAALYPTLPDKIPTHWNVYGEVDGWSSRAFGSFLMPGTMAGLLLLLLALPWLSPKNFTVDSFRTTYNYVMFVIVALMGFMHVVILRAATDQVDVGRVLVVGMCLFFALIGNVLGKVKRNFWMGVRTPWTLASAPVWEATHRFAGRLWVIGGIVAAVAGWLGGMVLAFVLIMAIALTPALYSLLLYKKLERAGRA